MLRAFALTATFALAPLAALAVGSDTDTPPTTTSTTTKCEGTQIWDEKTESCVDAKESRFDDADRFDAVRELAYAGALDRAEAVLATFSNPADDGRLTYLGFVARQKGDLEGGMAWYRAALAQNPDNLLARSYMGMAYLVSGDEMAARTELREIRARGGRETWAARALDLALRGGPTPAY